MSTNVLCDHCGVEFLKDEQSVIVDNEIVRAYHVECARQIHDAYRSFRAFTSTRGHVAVEPSDLAPLERRVERIEAVWKLWITEAENGRISQATFHTMKHLLGLDKG